MHRGVGRGGIAAALCRGARCGGGAAAPEWLSKAAVGGRTDGGRTDERTAMAGKLSEERRGRSAMQRSEQQKQFVSEAR